MTTGSLIRTVTLAAMLAASSLATTAASGADVPTSVVRVAASEATSRFIPLGVGKSVAIDLPEDIKDVLVADPTVANAVVRTARRVYMIGVKEGQTNIFFFDAQGRQIAGFDIAVTRDLNGIRSAIRQALPSSDIRVEGVGAAVMLSGTASSPADAQQAFDIAAKLAGGTEKVVNGIAVSGRDQVMLKVTVAEVARSVIKQLGIDLSGKLNYGSFGNGSAAHLAAESFKMLTHVDMTHVPYKGSAPALNGLLAGQVDLMFDVFSTSAPLVKAGRLHALAVTSKQRSPELPNVPTMDEAGVKNLSAGTWFGLLAPAGTSKEVVDRLNKAVNKALSEKQVRDTLGSQGALVAGGTSAEFAQFFQSEYEKMGTLAKAIGIKVD